MIRTWSPVPRIAGDVCVYTVVDEHLRYVTVYIPFAATGHDDVARTINHALDTRPAPPAKERVSDG